MIKMITNVKGKSKQTCTVCDIFNIMLNIKFGAGARTLRLRRQTNDAAPATQHW
jgi:hypothetical protein